MPEDATDPTGEFDAASIKKEYAERLPAYERLQEEGRYILHAALHAANIRLDSLSSRVKTLDSLLGKAKRKQLSKPLEDIRDIVGFRIVCLFLSDISRISLIVRQEFTVLSEDNKIEGSEVSTFGYMSLHFTVTLKSEYVGPRYTAAHK